MLTNYERYLPHILPEEGTFFITFRLFGTLPQAVISQLLDEQRIAQEQIADDSTDTSTSVRKRHFKQFDTMLDKALHGDTWLNQPAIANIVKSSVHHHDGRDFTLHAYFIMPNHVHMLVTALPRQNSFYHVMKSLKGFSARRANTLLGRTGQPFWQPESYDHVVRSADEFKRTILYILNNPVKAGLTDEWQNWPYSFVAESVTQTAIADDQV